MTDPDKANPDKADPQESGPDNTGQNRRARGQAMVNAVYGWEFPNVEGPFVEATVDHLFGEVWADGRLSVKERRLMLIGMAVASGMEDVAGLQLDAAVRQGEYDADDLRSIVVFLAHYAGWPAAAKLNQEVEKIIAGMDSD